MYPELFRIGDFPVTTYGLMLAVGMVLGLFVASRLGARDGLPRERIYDLGLWTLIGGLLGSKILMLFTEPNTEIFSLDFLRSGGVYYGGFLGGLIAVAVLIPLYRFPFWKVSDAFAPALALGQAIGRQGCFAAGCCWGTECHLPWGVHFTEKGNEYTGVPVYGADGSALYLHPTQLYESFLMLAVFGILLYLHRKKRFDGQVLIAYMILYPIIRFIIEFFRADPRGDIAGLTSALGISTSQIISLIVAAFAVVFMIWRIKTVQSPKSEVQSQVE